jgi:F-type H+-transporting ATPase subunit gamma
MASLKELRGRIGSVKSTQKITSAMKMVAASKLKRSQDALSNSAIYYEGTQAALAKVVKELKISAREAKKNLELPKLLSGTGKDKTHLLVVFSSDRGLCGGFNANISKAVINKVKQLKDAEKIVKIICVGKKSATTLKREFPEEVIYTFENIGKKGGAFSEADDVQLKILEMFDAEEFDVCELVYNKFISAMSQDITFEQVVPVLLDEEEDKALDAQEVKRQASIYGAEAEYEFEPDGYELLSKVLPRHIVVLVYKAMLNSLASEHGARMTSMDSATRNAGDIIRDLTLTYNRTRQDCITTELIEIIAGAEAL